ncbi:MAG: YraN family protein [Candidatus Pacebacteria bacterium]|nr:YraN family protein [Candidatus Paceibacterota bacterium]
MPKIFTSKTQKTGEIGEHVACRYLEGKGYSILERNYTKKWGEIDIVARRSGVIYFVEVKSKIGFQTNEIDAYRPEDNMHPWKLKRLERTIQTYLMEKNIEGEWQLSLAVVYLSSDLKEAKVNFLENLVV